MAIKLTQEDIEKVKNYKYVTSEATPLDKVFDPWWNWCVSKLPMWVSPNLITCSGIILPIASFSWMCYHDSTMSEILPRSVLIFNGLGIFWY
jgi:ethanolaminephosphotransferase